MVPKDVLSDQNAPVRETPRITPLGILRTPARSRGRESPVLLQPFPSPDEAALGKEVDSETRIAELGVFLDVLKPLFEVTASSEDPLVKESVTVKILWPEDATQLQLENKTPVLTVLLQLSPKDRFPRTRVSVTINRSTRIGGGQWRTQLFVRSTAQRDSGKEIRLTAAVGSTAEETINVSSAAHANAPFSAAFLSGLSSELVVSPREGRFDAHGNLSVTITFHPIRYAGKRECVLALATRTKIWQYNIRGELPPYDVPTGVSKLKPYLSQVPSTSSLSSSRFRKK
jgi:hypothetical protein